MADRADVDRQRAEQAAVSARARAALDRFWGGLDLQDPQGSRDALVAFLPDLVASYGEAAAVVAADWYDDMREAAGAPHGFHAGLGDLVPDEAVVARARYGAQHLWTENPDQTRRFLLGVVDQYVKQAARNTLVQAGRRDPWKPRFARVPRGTVTCGFCLMLASRGPVYLTEKTAGGFTKFHGLCDCQIVPIGPNDPLPDGYDPDALYGEYLAAGRDPAVMDEGRDRTPARLRVPETLSPGSAALPAGFAPLGQGVWAKVIRRHATDATPAPGVTRFEGWNDEQIARAILETINEPDLIHNDRGDHNFNFHRLIDGTEVIVGTYRNGEVHEIITAYPPGPDRRRLAP